MIMKRVLPYSRSVNMTRWQALDHRDASRPPRTVFGSFQYLAGTCRLTGSLTDGFVIVDSQDDQPITLVLDGVDVTNCTGPEPLG
jgi:hypothetical protein